MGASAEEKRAVSERAGGCCEYCLSQLKFSPDAFSIEHIWPRSLGGVDDVSNYALSCQQCNNHKFVSVQVRDPLTGALARLFHPRQDRWDNHFAWSADYLLFCGLTPTGRATIDKLHLNRDGVVNLRRILRDVGFHPPIRRLPKKE